MKFSQADSRVKMWSFSDISASNTVPTPAHPEDGDGVSSQNFRKTSHLDVAVCPRKFHWSV